MRKFILLQLKYIFLPLFIYLAFNFYIIRYSNFDLIGMLNFQVNKLEKYKGNRFNVIYIGDSSGGNCMETENTKNLNLCLSGSFTYLSQIEFVKIIDRYINYDTILVINTIDIPTRHENRDMVNMLNLFSTNFVKEVFATVKLRHYFKNAFKNRFNNSHIFGNVKDEDYISSTRKIQKDSNLFNLTINSNQIKNIKKLNDFLSKNNREYFFVFGPSLPYNPEYFEEICSLFKNQNIRHKLNEPYSLNFSNVGDSEDHIHPDSSWNSTRYYMSLIRNK